MSKRCKPTLLLFIISTQHQRNGTKFVDCRNERGGCTYSCDFFNDDHNSECIGTFPTKLCGDMSRSKSGTLQRIKSFLREASARIDIMCERLDLLICKRTYALS